MKDGKPESLAEALLLLEKMNARLSEKDQKIREQQAEIKILNEKLAVKRAREFASKTESLKKLYESQPFLFDAEEMGLKLENQCPEISDEDIAQALSDDDLFDRKSERKKPGRTRNKSKNLPRQNMCNWSLKVHERLKPLETLLNSELKKTKLLMFDESPVEVLKVDSEELKAEYWDEARYRKNFDQCGRTQRKKLGNGKAKFPFQR